MPVATSRPGVSGSVLESFSGVSEGKDASAVDLLCRLSLENEPDERELKYSIGRLVKGTAASKRVARESYYSALSVLLSSNKNVSFEDTFRVLTEQLQMGGQSKSELSEICTGQVLVCGAVLRSDLFTQCSDEEKAKVISTLFTASEKKSYLGIAAYYFIADFIKNNSEETVRTHLWPLVQEKLAKPIEEHNLDSLYCLLILNDCCPHLAKKFTKKNFKVDSLFNEEIASKVADKLMNVPEFSYINHPIYEILGKSLVRSEHLISFWTDGLEKRLSLHNENRVLIVLTVLQSILKNIGDNVHLIPVLLSEKFIPCILEWFKGFQSAKQGGKIPKHKGKQKFYLNDSKGKQILYRSKDVFETLSECLKAESVDSNVKLEVLKKLLFSPGDIMFCDITNLRVIRVLIESLGFDSVKEFAGTLTKIISNESKKSQNDSKERYWTNSERLRATEMLTYLINHKTANDHIKWRIKQMQFLIRISLFRLTGHEDSYISSELAAAIKKSFFRCLTVRLPNLDTLLKVLSSLVDHIDSNLSNHDVKINSKHFQPEVLNSWKSMKEFISRLEAVDDSKHSKAHTVFHILALYCGLFLFSDLMDIKMSQNSLQEVQSCYEHFLSDTKKDQKNGTIIDGDIVEETPEWTEVLVDVFLSFLSKDSLLLRNVVQIVFRLLCEYLTVSAVGQILSVLDPDDEANLLSYRDSQFDDDNVSDSSDKEEEEDNESEESEESENDEDVDNSTVNDQLRIAVRKALGTAAPETDTESIDIDNMDEEEGKRLDNALSEAFKSLKQSKGETSKKDKKNAKILMEFRIRSLDLIHIYLEKVQSMDVCLAMLSPLLKCLEYALKDSTQKSLEDKARKCLKCLTAVKSFSSTDGVTVDMLADCLTFVTERGSRTQFVFQALGDVVSKCGTFLVRCSQKLASTTPSKKKKKQLQKSPLVNIYRSSLEAFFTKRDCLLPVIFFHEVLQTNWEGNSCLLSLISEKIFDDTIRQFRRNEGLEMINVYYIHLKRTANIESEDVSDLKTFEEEFSSKVSKHFEAMQESNSQLSERFFSIMLKTLVSIKNYYVSKSTESFINFSDINIKIQEHRRRIKLKNAQEYNKFCKIFNLENVKNSTVPNAIPKKDTVDSEGETDKEESQKDDSDVESNDQKKLNAHSKVANAERNNKKNNRLSKKQVSKKEAKRLRMLASSDGLQDVSFTSLLRDSNVDVNDITEEPEITEKSPKVKRKVDHTNNENIKKKRMKVL